MTRHKTPIKVVAHAGEQTREQYETSAIDLFCYVPQQWRGIRDWFCLSRAILAIARINSVSLQCEVIVYRLAACAEVARDYWPFVVSRFAPEESRVSRYEHQRHSYFW
jgi:hypothetical protein